MRLLIVIFLFWGTACAAVLPSSFRVEFEQIHKSVLRKRKQVSQVSLDYKFPSQIILETQGQTETRYVSNGKTSWYYTAPFIPDEQGEVIVQNKVDLGLLKFFDSLKKGLKKNDYFQFNYHGRKLTFEFTPKGIQDLSLSSAVFHAKNSKKLDDLTLKDFEKIVLNKTNKKTLELIIKKVDESKKFNSRHFYFKPPKNTKVVKR